MDDNAVGLSAPLLLMSRIDECKKYSRTVALFSVLAMPRMAKTIASFLFHNYDNLSILVEFASNKPNVSELDSINHMHQHTLDLKHLKFEVKFLP